MGGFLVVLLMYFLQFVFVCACVCLQPAVPIWWSDLGSIMVLAGVLFRDSALAPAALWAIRNHLHQPYPKHTTTAKGVAPPKRSLYGFYWFPHLRASLLLLLSPIRAQHATQGLWLLEHSWSSQFNDRLPSQWERSYAVCLGRHHSGLDSTTLNVQQKTAPNVCK